MAGKLQGKKVAMLIEQEFEDVEVTQPLDALQEEGVEVTIIGSGKGEYTGKKGMTVREDLSADVARAEDYDALVVPGGRAPEKMRMCEPMVELVQRFDAWGKPIAAVCHGPQLLISADVLRGRRTTSYPSIAVDLRNAGAEWVDEEVVEDGPYITSRGPDDLPAFSRALVRKLAEIESQEATTGATPTYGETHA